MTNEKFIEKSNLIHNNLYRYISEYKGSRETVDIFCEKHGVFSQRADIHMNGSRCPKCVYDEKYLTNEKFIEKANLVHNFEYEYIDEYINSKKMIRILCREHGIFNQRPNSHLQGQGCSKCSFEKMKITNEKFIEISNNIHNFKYKYNDKYINIKTKISIVCKEHGEFKQRPDSHMKGSGCNKCIGLSMDKSLFIEKANSIHNKIYDYSLTDYINTRTKISIICKEHGEFKQTPNKHLVGRGCPKCGNKFGILEKKWLDSLKIEENNRQVKIENYVVDGIDYETNTIYEFNGNFWHGNPKIYKKDDINKVNGFTFGELYKKTLDKENYLKSIGYKVISIWESDFH